MALLEEEKTILDHNNDDLIKRKFQLELTIKDLIERNTFNQSTEDELERLDQTIKEKETELEKVGIYIFLPFEYVWKWSIIF